MKKLNLVMGFSIMGLFLNSCAPAYVETEPTYIAVVRPASPGPNYVWADGNWNWNHRRHVYIQSNGYWTRPYRGRAYVPGRWQTSPRGHHWVRSTWH